MTNHIIKHIENRIQNELMPTLNYLNRVLEMNSYLTSNNIQFELQSNLIDNRFYVFNVMLSENCEEYLTVKIHPVSGYIISESHEDDIVVYSKEDVLLRLLVY